jgi:hypothetical protein
MTVLTKAKIDIKNGLIELEGSETFVSEGIKLYSDLLTNYYEEEFTEENEKEHENINPELSMNPPSISKEIVEDVFVKHFGVTEEELNSVIYTEAEGFRIITNEIKGKDAEKQTSLSLLYCLTNEFYGHKTDTGNLRDLCEYFACLDSKNFATYLKKKNRFFILEGEKGSKKSVVKLTAPGKEEARRLLKTLIQGE